MPTISWISEIAQVVGAGVAVAAILASSRVIRAILESIFTHPRVKTLIGRMGDDYVIRIDNPSPEAMKNLEIRLTEHLNVVRATEQASSNEEAAE
jgi:hypothetical protein